MSIWITTDDGRLLNVIVSMYDCICGEHCDRNYHNLFIPVEGGKVLGILSEDDFDYLIKTGSFIPAIRH